jgi:ERCC4-type nuclease
MPDILIIADYRERAVRPYFEKLSEQHRILYEAKQMTVGDYAICIDGQIRIIIERKTWEDLASSMRDGRKENVNKLIKLRQETGCKIFYIIEGEACPRSGKKFGRIPYKSLLAHLDHLMIRDDIHIIHSTNCEQTAERLFLLAWNFISIKPTVGAKENTVDIIEDTKDIEDVKEDIKESNDNEWVSITTREDIVDYNNNNQIDLLTAKQEVKQATDEVLLKCFPAIGPVVSSVLIENKVRFRDVCLHKYRAEHYACMKYNTGQTIGLDRGKKIEQCHKYIDGSSISKIAQKVQLRVLESIPRMGKSSHKILETYLLKDIIGGQITLEQLAAIQVSEKKKIGQALATNIISALAF